MQGMTLLPEIVDARQLNRAIRTRSPLGLSAVVQSTMILRPYAHVWKHAVTLTPVTALPDMVFQIIASSLKATV